MMLAFIAILIGLVLVALLAMLGDFAAKIMKENQHD